MGLKERNVLGNAGRIISKYILRKQWGLDWIDQALVRVKWRDEPWRSITCGEFLDRLRKYWLLNSAACSSNVLGGSPLARAAFDLRVFSYYVNNTEFFLSKKLT